jgi:hypothetical protein
LRLLHRSVPLLLLALLAPACGKKGPPLPPNPRGPLPATEVAARQLGGDVLVTFRVPEPRGQQPARQPVRAELIRVAYAPGYEAQPDPSVFRRRGELVAILEGDPLPSGELRRLVDGAIDQLQDGGIGSTLRYAVRVRDRRGRSSPLVVARDLVPVAPLPAPTALQAEPTADGVRLVWTKPAVEGQLRYNVYRAAPGEEPAPDPLNPQPLSVTEFLDGNVTVAESYLYTVRVALAESAPYREGEPSLPLEIRAEDRFPPAAPERLVAVQEGAAVRLFWDPNRERDLAGYRVYRRIGDGGWTMVGPDPVERALYLDQEVAIGQQLSYRVTAVDRADPPNESKLSVVVELELQAEPGSEAGEEQ